MNRTVVEIGIALKASVVRYVGGTVLDRHTHDTAGVSVVLAGAIEEEVGSKSETGGLGSIVVKPAGVEHRNRIGSRGAIVLAIKGKETDEVADEGWRWTQSRRAAAVGIELVRDFKAGLALDVDQLLDLLGIASATARKGEARRSKWIDEIRVRLERAEGVPSVTALAKAANMHPVYLARAFRAHVGCSIREYRRNIRVRRAADLLADSDLSVAAVAARLDFFDQSHLCRDFKAELNVSPSNYRKIVRS